jgi:hypothetical protein
MTWYFKWVQQRAVRDVSLCNFEVLIKHSIQKGKHRSGKSSDVAVNEKKEVQYYTLYQWTLAPPVTIEIFVDFDKIVGFNWLLWFVRAEIQISKWNRFQGTRTKFRSHSDTRGGEYHKSPVTLPGPLFFIYSYHSQLNRIQVCMATAIYLRLQ